MKAHEVSLEKTAGLGSRIDIRLAMIRIGFFHGDHTVISDNIEKAQMCVCSQLDGPPGWWWGPGVCKLDEHAARPGALADASGPEPPAKWQTADW